MSADIIDLRAIFEREHPDAEFARRAADRALHLAVQAHKAAYCETITIARLKQIVAATEFFNVEARREAAGDDRG